MTKNTREADKKSIRVYATELLRQRYPEFGGLPRQRKRELAKELAKAIAHLSGSGIGFDGVPEMSAMERLGLGRFPEDIMSLKDMEKLVENEKTLIDVGRGRRRRRIKDPFLKLVDGLLNDRVLNRLLSTESTTPTKRTWMPSDYFRTELLRSLMYPELSVRKYCERLEDTRKYAEDRAFCGMDKEGDTIDHSSLSTFRGSLTLAMRVNLMVYMMYLFQGSGRLAGAGVYALDSTDVATQINPCPLAKVEMPDGSFIRFYGDLDADCGSRRKKRDKSDKFVGYRVHTLCVVDPESKVAFPLLSLAVAANHHDSQMLQPLVDVAETIGLDIKILLGDDAYGDLKAQEALCRNGISLLTPDRESTPAPEGVDSVTGEVRISSECPYSMRWDGYDTDEAAHLFVCGDDDSDCFFRHVCPKERHLPLDYGVLRPIPTCTGMSENVMDLRKVTERPFNLMKHMDGMEPCRMKTLATVSSQVVFSQIAGLFRTIAGLRSMPKVTTVPRQEVLPKLATG